MAIRIEDEYTNATVADAAYPGGSFKNESAPGNLDGTPLERAWANDLLGFRDRLMALAGVPYSAVPDTAQASDAVDALLALFVAAADAVSTATADKVMRRDANGRSKVATPSASDDIATKGYVDTKLARFKSTAFSWTLGGSPALVAFNHGLGAAPMRVWISAQCTSADLGYSVGEWVHGLTFYDGSTLVVFPIKATATVVSVAVGDHPPRIVNHISGPSADQLPMTLTKWNFYLFAEI
jgi:hypothetical protein